MVERFEPPFRIKKREPNLQRKIDDGFQYALQTGGQAQLVEVDRCEDFDVLKAFRRLVKHSNQEYAVVALSARYSSHDSKECPSPGILHDIFQVDALGLSTRDRDILAYEYERWLDTQGLVKSDFYLAEGRYFRKFVLPSATDAWSFFQQLRAAQ